MWSSASERRVRTSRSAIAFARGARTPVRGVISDALVTVVNVQWYGSEALELTFKTAAGKVPIHP